MSYNSKSSSVILTSSISHDGKTFMREDSSLDLSKLTESERQLVLLGMKVMQQHSTESPQLERAVAKFNSLVQRLHPGPSDQEPSESDE
jgi:hypothetical protein